MAWDGALQMDPDQVRMVGGKFGGFAAQLDPVATSVKAIGFTADDAGRNYHAEGQQIATGFQTIATVLQNWAAATRACSTSLADSARGVQTSDEWLAGDISGQVG